MIYHPEKLKDVHPDLVAIIEEYGQKHDIIIVDGYRDEKSQNLAYAKGNSKVKFPHSKHNVKPSKACDVAPTLDKGQTINWRDSLGFDKMADDILFIARKKNLKVVWGGFFRMVDKPHFELFY